MEKKMPRANKSKKQENVVKTEVVASVPEIVVPVPPSIFLESKKMWEEVKDVQLNMFSLPDQKVSQYCQEVTVEPGKLYVLIKVSSVLTALEDALSEKFNIQPVGKYVVITRK